MTPRSRLKKECELSQKQVRICAGAVVSLCLLALCLASRVYPPSLSHTQRVSLELATGPCYAPLLDNAQRSQLELQDTCLRLDAMRKPMTAAETYLKFRNAEPVPRAGK